MKRGGWSACNCYLRSAILSSNVGMISSVSIPVTNESGEGEEGGRNCLDCFCSGDSGCVREEDSVWWA